MKFNTKVTSQPSKARKAVYTADARKRMILMSAPLSKELRAQYNVKSLPIHKDDEVKIVRGHEKVAGKVTAVKRSKYVINIDKLTRTKANGQTVPVPVKPSNVVITKLFLNKDRTELLTKKGDARKKYMEARAKKQEEVEKAFKEAYPSLSYDIFTKKGKVESIAHKKFTVGNSASKFADRFVEKHDLKRKNQVKRMVKAKKAVAAYKAALAKKIAK